MKTIKLGMLVVAVAVTCSLMADTETVGDYTWTYRINGDTAEITRISPDPTGSVTIPSSLGGKPVTGIGRAAFRSCTKMTSVTIPNCVMEIGQSAFANCYKLASVIIPNCVTNIGQEAFRDCGRLTNVVIPDSVTSVGYAAFYNCKGLMDVTIGNGVTRIERSTFSDCSGLTSVIIGSGVTSIERNAFHGCSLLTSMYFSGNAPEVESERAFTRVFGCTVYVRVGSTGWGVDIPGAWNGMRIEYLRACDELYGGVVEDVTFSKAQLAFGALYDANGTPVGTVELKFGKINARKQTVKVSASATILIDGKAKKMSANSATIKMGADGSLGHLFVFKTAHLRMAFVMDGGGMFTMKNSSYEMVGVIKEGDEPLRRIVVGGSLARNQMKFNVAMARVPDFGEAGTLLEAALPVDEPVYVAGGTKWSFDKVPSLKYAKDRTTGAYSLIGFGDPAKPNVAGLKLTYTTRTGLFKGSFKVYATNEGTTPAGKSPRLKRFTVNVIGFMVDGVGYGSASLKKPAATWAVTVE